MRKKQEEAQKKAAEQKEIAEEREKEKKDTKAYEEAKELRNREFLAVMRKTKTEMWETQKREEEAAAKRLEAETKARWISTISQSKHRQ